MRSLRTKLVLIMILLILALMTVIGSFLINGVGNFYIGQFYNQMTQTFSPDFIRQLQGTAAAGPRRMKELLMAQSDLGVDIAVRNVYILDSSGTVLDGSNQTAAVSMTPNLLTALNGAVGENSSITTSYMDLAVPIAGEDETYIVYVLDGKATVNALTSDVLRIILQSLVMGLVICMVLSFLLAQILITPIRALTAGTRQVAAGDFTQKVEVSSRDEIGDLTRNFNYMSRVLQDTLGEAENERNKLSTLFLHMTDGVVAFDTGGALIHHNPAAVQMLGRNLDGACQFDDIFSAVTELPFVLSLRPTEFVEAEQLAGERSLELFMAPFSSGGTRGGAIVVIHDVTEQRKSEQARREFVANVSHELRTPLTNVKSYAETIAETTEDGDRLPPELEQQFLGVIISEADRMTRIVQDLLTLSKFDYGKMEMNISRFSFAATVRNVCEAEAIDAKNHSHTLTVDVPDELPEVNGDKERIEQVLMNVISNAIKYTPDGGHITVRAGVRDQFVWASVEDDGIGIPEKDLPQLFERFYRVDKARSRESGGTGLGLSIAREIMSQHKGDILLDSVYGQGTTVTVTLPTADGKE
ncbi:MAG: cell wall metabolism sensor histidine kinase WalK [Oscillospiraceae bacterium]|nr:cell wall metabolism sensor histidine kinase WalK [Oscillospiraceae bacterium]